MTSRNKPNKPGRPKRTLHANSIGRRAFADSRAGTLAPARAGAPKIQLVGLTVRLARPPKVAALTRDNGGSGGGNDDQRAAREPTTSGGQSDGRTREPVGAKGQHGRAARRPPARSLLANRRYLLPALRPSAGAEQRSRRVGGGGRALGSALTGRSAWRRMLIELLIVQTWLELGPPVGKRETRTEAWRSREARVAQCRDRQTDGWFVCRFFLI